MFFYKRGEMNAETLEVYRICARLDSTDPLPIIRDRGVGQDWLKRLGFRIADAISQSSFPAC